MFPWVKLRWSRLKVGISIKLIKCNSTIVPVLKGITSSGYQQERCKSIWDVFIQYIFLAGLDEWSSFHHFSGALIHPMTIFMNVYYVPGLSPGTNRWREKNATFLRPTSLKSAYPGSETRMSLELTDIPLCPNRCLEHIHVPHNFYSRLWVYKQTQKLCVCLVLPSWIPNKFSTVRLMSLFYKWETKTQRSHTTSWRECQDSSPHLLITNSGFFPVYQEGNKTSHLPEKRRPVLPTTTAASCLHKEMSNSKCSKQGHSHTLPHVPKCWGSCIFPLASWRPWDVRYYLQPKYINHLKTKIRFRESLGVCPLIYPCIAHLKSMFASDSKWERQPALPRRPLLGGAKVKELGDSGFWMGASSFW